MNNIFLTQSQPSIRESENANSTEIELLLCCARTKIETDTEERINLLLQQDIDWAYLCETSSHHGVMPLLYQSLKTTYKDIVPEKILTKLRFHSQANDLRNHYLAEELIDILHQLQAEGILAVPFKGPSLSITAYKNLSLRQFSDLDILVAKKDFLKAKNLLVQLEFDAINDLSFSDRVQEELYLQEIDEFTLIRSQNSIDVICDLHQAITVSHFRKCKIELTKIKNKLTTVKLNKAEINTIEANYLLVLLCIHASRHFWEQLNWICDINELINSQKKINWEEALNESTALGCKYHLLLGLYLSNHYLGTKIPQEMKEVIDKSWRIKYLSKYVSKNIFAFSNCQPSQGFNLNNFIYQMLLTNGWQGYREIIEYFVIPNTKDKLIFDFPRRLSFLYYFLRPFRLFYQLIGKSKSKIFH